MQKLNGFRRLNRLKFFISVMTFLVVVSAGVTANADIVIDNQLIPSSDITSISISPITGLISISTTGYTVTKDSSTTPPPPGAVVINSFNASAGTVIQGETVVLSWSTTNATSCTPSNGFGGWEGSSISLPTGSMSIASPFIANGTFTFNLNCAGNSSTTASKAVSVSVTAPSTGNAVTIDSFTPSATQIDQGGSVNFSWSTTNAASCTATGGFGGWAGITVGLPSASQAVSGFSPGTFTFSLNCQGAAGSAASKTINVTVGSGTPPPPPPPPPTGDFSISSFTTSSATVLPNQAFTLSWATVSAASCKGLDGAGGWSQPLNLSGSMTLALSTADTYTFTLRCVDEAGNVLAKTVDVVVIATASSQVCNPSTSLANTAIPLGWGEWWQKNNETGVAHVFPSPLNETIARLDVGQCGYNSISFNTGAANGVGNILLIPTTSSEGLRMGSISSVPGDFAVADECKQLWGLGGWIAYTTSGVQGLCQLQKGLTYYLNFTFTNGTDASTSTCTSPVTRADGSLLCEVEIQAKFTPQ